MEKTRSPRNRTLTLSQDEIPGLKQNLLYPNQITKSDFINRTINGDILESLNNLPDEFADLIIIDPPYNLSKDFNGMNFRAMSDSSYDEYLSTWFPAVCKKLKKNGSLYMCGDWICTSSLQEPWKKNLS